MRWRFLALPLIAVLLASALAGCLGGDDGGSGPSTATNTSASEEPDVGLVADTPEAKANATQVGEFQKSLDDRHHFHDLWGGKTEIVLFEGDVAAGPSTPPAGLPPPREYFATFQDGNVGATSFFLPDGTVVLPEANEMVVTLTYETGPTLSGLRLGWKNAAEKRSSNYTDVVAPGSSVVIPTSVAVNDIPHATVSKWAFRLVPDNGASPAVWNGTAKVVIAIKRDPVLLLAPPHPDLWMNDTVKVLAHESFKARARSVLFPMRVPDDGEGFGQRNLTDGVIVPPHTGQIRVLMNWTNTAPLAGQFNPHPNIAFTPANTRQFRLPDEVKVSGNTLEALITVDAKMVDSPYDTVSNWAFFLYLDSDSPGVGAGPFGRIADFDGTIDLRIEAVREDKVM